MEPSGVRKDVAPILNSPLHHHPSNIHTHARARACTHAHTHTHARKHQGQRNEKLPAICLHNLLLCCTQTTSRRYVQRANLCRILSGICGRPRGGKNPNNEPLAVGAQFRPAGNSTQEASLCSFRVCSREEKNTQRHGPGLPPNNGCFYTFAVLRSPQVDLV